MSEKRAKEARRAANQERLRFTRTRRMIALANFFAYYTTQLPDSAKGNIADVMEQVTNDIVEVMEKHGGNFLAAAGLSGADYIQGVASFVKKPVDEPEQLVIPFPEDEKEPA